MPKVTSALVVLLIYDVVMPIIAVKDKPRQRTSPPPQDGDRTFTDPTRSGANSDGCVDLDAKCAQWSREGECQTNAGWMMANCRLSCQSCQGGNKAWQLRQLLAKNYDNLTRSMRDVSNVIIDSLHVDHVEVHEEAQTVSLHGRIVINWNDHRLRWEPSQWGIQWINFYWAQVWTPQLVQRDAPMGTVSNISWQSLAANYTGQVYMWSSLTLTIYCPMDYGRWPSDVQQCCTQLDETRQYLWLRINVSESATNDAIKDSHISGWTLEDVRLSPQKYAVKLVDGQDEDPYDISRTNCLLCVKVRRSAAYRSVRVIGPCVAGAVITLTSFLLFSYYQQVSMLIASLAVQVLSLGVIQTSLPPASGAVPLVLRFCGISLGLSLLSLLLCVLLWRLSNAELQLPLPYKLKRILELIVCHSWCNSNNNRKRLDEKQLESPDTISQTGELNGQQKMNTPISTILHRLFFILMLAIYIFAMIACLT